AHHGHQDPRRVRRPLYQVARGGVYGEHDARGHLEGARRSWRARRDATRRRRRQRGRVGTVRRRRDRRGRPGRPAPGRRREVVRRLLAGAHGRDRWEERRPGQGQLRLTMRVLVVDVGGTHVKVLASELKTSREFSSGPAMTAKQMVAGVKAAAEWEYDVVSIGYPG